MKNDAPSRRARILLIEDNPADAHLIKYALDKGHFQCAVSVLKDGAEALAFIRKEAKYAHAPRPDLVVMDLHLPKNDGLEVLEEIHRTREFAHLPVAVLSSSVWAEEKNRVAALAGTFISKPLDLDGYMTVATKLGQLSLKLKASAAGAAL